MPTIPVGLAEGLRDRYVLERELGRGGMATVYAALDVRHDRPVALKVLRSELGALLGADRFLREIRLAARLNHPHIVPIFDSGETAGHLWYAMPLSGRGSLRDRLRQEVQLPVADAVQIARDVLAALACAHQHGIIHRDIKPENILLEESAALVTDFGIARAVDVAAGDRLTETGLVLGTPTYMSPEQTAADRSLDGRSDLYAVGCVLYEMLAGEPPITGPTPQAIFAKRLSGPVPSVRTLRAQTPEALEGVISRCLALAPADRFATADECARALELPAATGPTLETPATRAPRRRRQLLIAAGLAAVLGVAWLAARAPRAPRAPPSPTRLAVLPFTIPPGSPASYLGEGLVDLLSRDLDGAGDLRTVDAATVLTVVRQRGDPPDTERGRELARRLGAGQYVLGSVHSAGGRLRIQAALYSGEGGDARDSEAVSQATVEGDSSALFELVDRLSAQLLARRLPGPGIRLVETAAMTSRSLPALKAYLESERQLRAAELDSALTGFQQATVEDTTFALAYYRLAVTALWADRPGIAGPALERAMALSQRLSERDRRLLEALAALRRGDADGAEQRYRSLLADYADDIEAGFQLSLVLWDYNPPRGRALTEAGEVATRVQQLNPKFLCPL